MTHSVMREFRNAHEYMVQVNDYNHVHNGFSWSSVANNGVQLLNSRNALDIILLAMYIVFSTVPL